MRRAAIGMAALLVTFAGGLLVPVDAADRICGGAVSDAGNAWFAIRPQFTIGGKAVTQARSAAFDPDLIYATNGAQVVRSEDAGCSWVPVLDAAQAAADAQGGTSGTVRQLTLPSSANSSEHIYAAMDTQVEGVRRPLVLSSANRGDDWTASSAYGGLPVVGTILSLTASGRLPRTAYALVDQGVGGRALTRTIWTTHDGGAAWTQRTPTGEAVAADELVVSPVAQNTVFALLSGRVQRSNDGGRSFLPLRLPGDATAAALDAAVGGGGIRLVTGHTKGWVHSSGDGGETWKRTAVGAETTSVAMVPMQNLAIAGDDSATFLVPAGGAAVDISPTGAAAGQLGASAPTPGGLAVTGLRGGAILRTTRSLDLETAAPTSRGGRLQAPVQLLPGAKRGQFPTTLTPQRLRVNLPAGATTEVPYQLLLPRTPTPMDVMFLVDTTGSMGGVIDGLRVGLGRIVDALNTSGLDVRVGLGSFKDYAPPHGAGNTGDYAYRLDRGIGLADREMAAAISTLTAGGGGDEPESALTALFQSATGKGESIDGTELVPARHHAGYRAKALRFALLATDTRFHRPSDSLFDGKGAPYPGPNADETITALKKKKVHVAGLAASPAGVSDLEMVAKNTGALTPRGGVDCDGDGRTDVAAGQPLVCLLDASTDIAVSTNGVRSGQRGGPVQLTEAVTDLAESIADRKDVRLRVTRGAAVATVVGRTVRRGIDVRANNEVPFVLRLTCPLRRSTSTHHVAVASSVATVDVAKAGLELVCGGAVAAVSRLGPPAAVGPDGSTQEAAAAAPPGPQQPITNVNPNANANANTNPNPNPNINPNLVTGIAAQHQEQGHLALVREKDTEGLELAMSDHHGEPGRSPYLVGVGLVFAAAAGLALRTQRPSPGVVRAR